MSVSRSNVAAPFASPRVWDAFMVMSNRDAQNRCLSTTCSARSRKYGIQPMEPSDSAIFRPGNLTKLPLNSQSSSVPAWLAAAEYAMNASVGMSSEVRIRLEDEPTCIETTNPASWHACHSGSQWSVWIDGSPSLTGFSENAIDFAPRATVRSTSAAAATESHSGMIIIGMNRPGYAAASSSRMKSFQACTHSSPRSLSLASWKTWPQYRGNDGNSIEESTRPWF